MCKKLIIFCAIFFILSNVALADYFDDIKCHQHISTQPKLKLVYTNVSLFFYWYRCDNASIKFGDVKSDLVNYLFMSKWFFGKVVAIYGSEDINEVLRFLQKEHGGPFRIKNRTYTWLTNDKVIFVKRFSLHLAQVEILCRELYAKYYGDSYEEIKFHF